VFDVAPTILDYAGIPVPSNFAATSLRSRIHGDAPGKQSVLCHFVTNDRSAAGVCLRTDIGKYIQWSDTRGNEFYDVKNDPLERANRVDDPEYQPRVRQHRELLIQRLATTPR
jgi:arylsulfatase A-like enzyme